MDEFLKMDIFFFITAVAVVALAALGAVVLWRLARILKNVDHISEQASLETDEIRHNLAGVRADIRRGRGRLRSILGFFNKQGSGRSRER